MLPGGDFGEATLLGYGISRIKAEDAGLFQKFFDASNRLAYANSWTYVTQAANGYSTQGNSLGYKLYNGRVIAALGWFMRPVDGRLCFHVINPQGKGVVSECERICKDLAKIEAPIYIKKIETQFRRQLVRKEGFLDGRLFPWHAKAPLEDDTFPEVLVDLCETSELLTGKGANDLKDKVRRFRSRHLDSEVVWRELRLARKDAFRVVEAFFADYVREDISRPTDYRNMIEDSRAREGLISEVVYIKDRPVGILVMEGIGRTPCIGLYCNLCLYQEHRYLSEYVVATALLKAASLGYRYVNLGGSETATLDRFKRKFSKQPIVRSTYWLVHNP